MPRWFASLLLILVVVAPPVYVAWADEPGPLHAKEAAVAKLVRSNRDLRSEVTELRRRIGALRDDPRFLEQVAREELGWIRDGETVYRITTPPGTAPDPELR